MLQFDMQGINKTSLFKPQDGDIYGSFACFVSHLTSKVAEILLFGE